MCFTLRLLSSALSLTPPSFHGLHSRHTLSLQIPKSQPLGVSPSLPSLYLSLCFPSAYFELSISPFLCSFQPARPTRLGKKPQKRKPVHIMLCSAPAAKSGLNWLDRLRSIKGIPTGDGLDLDSFLSNHCSSNSDPTLFPPKRERNRARGPESSTSDADPPSMGSVLAELFNMGSSFSQSSKLSGKKCPRKQTNPKSFVASSVSNSRIMECARKDEKNVPCTNSSANNLELERNEENMAGWDVEEEEDEEGGKEKESGVNELKGFSKSEVTVIDTSCPEWKVDKLVFRKSNVWKVRERKGKSKVFGKKKRKGSFGFDKELRLLDSQFRSPLDSDTEEFQTRSSQGQNTEKNMKDVGVDTSPV